MILNQTLLSDNEEQVITNDLIENVKNLNGVKDVRTLESTTATVPIRKMFTENIIKNYINPDMLPVIMIKT